MKKVMFIPMLLALAACVSAPDKIEDNKVFFAFDSAELNSCSQKELKAQELYMKKNPNSKVVLEGHCDERGSTEYNLALGALRAGNAAHALIKDGIEPERIKTISYGKENPQYPGTGEEVWAKNRNVTTKVK